MKTIVVSAFCMTVAASVLYGFTHVRQTKAGEPQEKHDVVGQTENAPAKVFDADRAEPALWELDPNDAVRNEIVQLIPQAAAIRQDDWAEDWNDIDDQPFTILILTLEIVADPPAEWNAEFQFHFELASETERLAQTISPRGPNGVASVLQNEYLRNVTCRVQGDRARGEITFACGMYEGRVQYAATLDDGKWKIVEFALPAHNKRTVLGNDGKWKIGPVKE